MATVHSAFLSFTFSSTCLISCLLLCVILIFLTLGTKQNGEVLGDVVLPPWAKGCPVEFIRLHREVS